MFKAMLVHRDNTPLKNKVKILEKFDTESFDFGNSDLDTYISQIFLPKLQKKEFNILFIKDNLSDNYLELYGITLAYHVRLSNELGDKRFVPIVIISDVDGYILNKITPTANILFTKNTFIARNEITSYEYFEKVFEQIKPFSDFKKEFLDLIKIDPPQDYLSHHDITNEWSIYRWAEFLKVESDATKTNKAKIENMLYFKYLKALYPVTDYYIENDNEADLSIVKKQVKSSSLKIVKKVEKPIQKILYIDDEWNKGWKDIFKEFFLKNHKQEFQLKTISDINKDTTFEELKEYMIKYIANDIPDLVLLDVRLIANDHNEINEQNLSGINLLKEIKENINPGIQIILLTASEKSKILNEASKYNILGYIKKESPTDDSSYTKEVFKKLINIINVGLERKYLKELWTLQQDILKLDLLQITFSFNLSDQEKKLLELKNNVERIFETLDSNIPKPFVYGMLIIYKCIEIICDYYIYEDYDRQEKKRKAYWIENNQIIANNGNTSVNNKIKSILRQLNIENQELNRLVNQLSCSRNFEIHSGEIKPECENKVEQKINEFHILEWFKMLKTIINHI